MKKIIFINLIKLNYCLPEIFDSIIKYRKIANAEYILKLANFPISELSENELYMITEAVKEFITKLPTYRIEKKRLHFNNISPACFVRYDDVAFAISKPDTKMTDRINDGEAGILYFTDGYLFEELLHTYNYSYQRKNNYLTFKLTYQHDGIVYYKSLASFVLLKSGDIIEQFKELHHLEHMRNNMFQNIIGLSRHEHIEAHVEARKYGHSFSDDNYFDYFRGILFDTDEEKENIIKGLNLIVNFFPGIKGIDILGLNLRKDITYLSVKEIFKHLEIY